VLRFLGLLRVPHLLQHQLRANRCRVEFRPVRAPYLPMSALMARFWRY
jgi:hypothetical protein